MNSLSAAAAKERLVRGDRLHMELGRAGARLWWFEAPLARVGDDVVSAVLFDAAPAQIMEAGDSLFGLPLNSQTWLVDGTGST